jgi:hypothetical protein
MKKNNKYQIVKDGVLRWRINVKLAKHHNLSDEQIATIREIYTRKIDVLDCMAEMDPNDPADESFIVESDKYLDECEAELQKAWGFEVNSNWYRFWERPHCTCPKLDNLDTYPHGHYVYNVNCPVHKYITVEALKKAEEERWKEECEKIKKDNTRAANWLMIFIFACCLFGLIAAGSQL